MSQPILSHQKERRASTTDTARSKMERVTPRAILLALFLTVVNDYWLVHLEVIRYSFATYAAPFYNCIFTLLVVTGVNLLVKKRVPRIALSQVEMITIYVMLSISSAVCSHNMMQILVSMMGYAFFRATPENGWDTLFLDKLPHWLTVSDPTSLKNLYFGDSTLYTPVNYGPWIVPVICWSVFGATLLFTMLCLNSIMRKQWVEAERLTFPVVTLPLEMTQESGSLFKNRHMWMGFAIAGAITLLAGIHYLYPSVPYLRIVRRDMGMYLTNPPWNQMGGLSLAFYFWAIGIAFLMPLELSFSVWFFYFMVKLELMMTYMVGLSQVTVPGGGFDQSYPFLNSQAYGAYLGFFVMSMWSSRKYLLRVLRTAFLGTGEEDDSREAVSYRTALIGVICGGLVLSVFARAIGMSVWVILMFFTFYFIFAMIISRIRAELGFPTHDMHFMPPQHLILTVAGADKLPQQNLVGFSMFFWFNRTYASHPSPHQLEAFKLGERTNSTARQMFVACLIAGIFALPIGFWMLLHNYYHYGGATARMEMWALNFGAQCYGNLDGWLRSPQPGNPTSMGFVGVGFLISILLGWMRVHFLWFPFHPLAYAISNSWGVHQLWAPIMIGSIAKCVTLKVGGLGAYRKALPFFLGLILGEITVGSLWTIIGIALGIPTYDFWPGKYG